MRWALTTSSANGCAVGQQIVLESNGWQLLNYLAIPFVAAIGIALLWLMTKRLEILE